MVADALSEGCFVETSVAAVPVLVAFVAYSKYYFVGSVTFAGVAAAYPRQDSAPSSASVGCLTHLQLVVASSVLAAVVEEK